MKQTIIAAATLTALSVPAFAELEGELSLTYNNQYSYRGVSGLLEDAANAVGLPDVTENTFDAAINLSWKLDDNWSITAGGNIHTISDSSIDHNRYRAGVRYTAECYHVELGYQSQDFRTILGNVETGEIYLNIGSDSLIRGIDLNLHVAHDVDVLEGTYVELSGHKSWEVADRTSLGLTVGVSYSFDYFENLVGSGNAWNNAYATLSLAYQATETLTITPYVTFSAGFDALEVQGFNVEEEEEVVFGVEASVSF